MIYFRFFQLIILTKKKLIFKCNFDIRLKNNLLLFISL